MIKYRDFEQKIIDDEPLENKKWIHILPAVPIAHRLRFLNTYEQGFDIPTCFDIVMTSQTLQEKQFLEFVDQMKKKVNRDKSNKTVKYKSPM